MENQNSRRKFIVNSLKATAAFTLAGGAITSVITSCNSTKTLRSKFNTPFTLQPLPYTYNALETVIDAKTMEIHYSKHAAGYSKNLIDAIKEENISNTLTLEDILSKTTKYSAKVRNNAGGHYNHEMFWKCMQPKTSDNKPTGKLLEAIEKAFGSFADFKAKFTDAAKTRFGSGWAWLYVDHKNNLQIGSTPNQDNPLMDVAEIKGFPLLCIDVWEHAYYLNYQNKRADYIENWWSLVNWKYVQTRLV
jgi:superoxide dismutase, Fe-Mn family